MYQSNILYCQFNIIFLFVRLFLFLWNEEEFSKYQYDVVRSMKQTKTYVRLFIALSFDNDRPNHILAYDIKRAVSFPSNSALHACRSTHACMNFEPVALCLLCRLYFTADCKTLCLFMSSSLGVAR